MTGFANPDAMRIEAVAPFGPPVFVIATVGGAATLLLPRESAVLTGETPDAVLEALTGVALGPTSLRALLTGCVSDTAVNAGTVFPGGWASLVFEDGSVMYLRRSGERWTVRGAARGGWRVEYPSWTGTFPATMRLQSADVDLMLELRQVEANVELDAKAFAVSVPPGTRHVTLDEIRRSGALKEPR